MVSMPFPRDEAETAAIQEIADSGTDYPVLMLNLNRYRPEAEFPNGSLYTHYMSVLEQFLPTVGGAILWRMPVLGSPVGDQRVDEILAAWYPTHRAFLELPSAPGADENYRARADCVEYAAIHRCRGESIPTLS